MVVQRGARERTVERALVRDAGSQPADVADLEVEARSEGERRRVAARPGRVPLHREGCVQPALVAELAAERQRRQLQFVQREEDNRCPDEAELRRRVGAQLGYDPFDAAAATQIEATIEHKANASMGV